MLSRELAEGLLPQTLLFHGPDGSGKFLAAFTLAKLLNCENPVAVRSIERAERGGSEAGAAREGDVCAGHEGGPGGDAGCASCRSIERFSSTRVFVVCKSNLRNSFDLWGRYGVRRESAGCFLRDLRRLFLSVADEERHRKESEFLAETLREPRNVPDDAGRLVELARSLLDAQKTPVISIDRVRELQRFLWMKSGDGGVKVVIIDGAEAMSEEAQNSFLKISEETPPDSHIVVTCARRDLLKGTIQSRFRAYRFIRHSPRVFAEIARERFGAAGESPGGDPLDEPGYEPSGYDPLRMREYLARLRDESTGVQGILALVDEIVGRGQAVQFLSYVVHAAGAKIRSAPRLSAEEVCRGEALMKTADSHRSAITRNSANPELSLTDFLLNNQRDIVQW
jgi:DNA polymerase III delta prime subunit